MTPEAIEEEGIEEEEEKEEDEEDSKEEGERVDRTGEDCERDKVGDGVERVGENGNDGDVVIVVAVAAAGGGKEGTDGDDVAIPEDTGVTAEGEVEVEEGDDEDG